MHTKEQYEAIRTVHDLLADSRKEYEAASHRVPEKRMTMLLLQISEERNTLGEELAQDLRRHDPRHRTGDGTLGRALHRAVLILRDTVTSTNEVNVLMEMGRQEADLVRYCNKVLRTSDLDDFSRATRTRQHTEIEKNMSRIHDLRRSLEAVEH